YDWNHAGHRAQVQDTLVKLAEAGSEVSIAPATVDDFLDFADDRGLAPYSSQTRSLYAAETRRTGGAVAWPPGPDERCWCGSGKKYARCCGD
ncbi:MAG: SEC-C domain-containing protein, partial [Pseudonocardiaceae bacterium]